MVLLFWDASGLVKRYTLEVGSETANILFTSVPAGEMATTPWGYLETYSIILRRFNGGVLDPAGFAAATGALQTEIVGSADFGLLPISEVTIFASVSVMCQHNLNATDAAILTMLLEYRQTLPPEDIICLVAADHRLLRAATAEGFHTLNPEAIAAADVPAFLAAL
jgi:hypothetical protein